jgi:EAL domain
MPPAEFIPLAEETGLVVELDRFVLRQACRQVAGWVADAGRLLLHVNLSAPHLLRGDLAANVSAALRDSGLPPDCLALEITESVLMHDLEVAIVRLQELKALGVHVAIDDFGTGYSSLPTCARCQSTPSRSTSRSWTAWPAGPRSRRWQGPSSPWPGPCTWTPWPRAWSTPSRRRPWPSWAATSPRGYHFSRPVPAADMARLAGQRPVAGVSRPA